MDEKTLFEEVKAECSVTWDDTQTNKRLESIINDGKAEFKDDFGLESIPSTGMAHRLFLAYCKYRYFDQYEDFKVNYKEDIINLRIEYEIQKYEKEHETTLS